VAAEDAPRTRAQGCACLGQGCLPGDVVDGKSGRHILVQLKLWVDRKVPPPLSPSVGTQKRKQTSRSSR